MYFRITPPAMLICLFVLLLSSSKPTDSCRTRMAYSTWMLTQFGSEFFVDVVG